MKKKIFRACGLCAVAALFVTCSRRDAGDSKPASDPTEQLPAKFKTQEPVAKPDFSARAKSPQFQKAIKEAAILLGAQPQSLESQGEEEKVEGGVSFDVPRAKVEAILRLAHTNYLARGFYLFRYDHNFGIGGRPDKVGLLPTRNKFEVMAAMDTNGDNYDIGTAGVIAWMQELEREQPFVLTGIGFDYMEGFFVEPVTNPDELAKRMYQFCPDIVDQGVGTVSKLANEVRNGRLYFWWD